MPILARYIQNIQLVDSYIYLKLPELFITKTRGFVFNAARTIDCIEKHGCNVALTFWHEPLTFDVLDRSTFWTATPVPHF